MNYYEAYKTPMANIMYKILGVYVFNVNPSPVANILTAENNEARKPPTISYMWALPTILK